MKGTLAEKGDAVIRAAAGGRLTPAEANSLLHALSAQAKLVEVDDLIARIEALENGAEESRKTA